MSYQTYNLFELGMHEVGCLDELVATGGSSTNHYVDLTDKTYHYLLNHKEQEREISIRTVEVDDDTVEVYMVEMQYGILPKQGSRFVAFSFLKKGKPSVKLNWEPWVQERTVVVSVASPYDNEEFADVAEKAADMLREEYFSSYKDAMKDAPLEDMVLTQLIRH